MNEPAINSRSRDPAAFPDEPIINNFNNSMKNHKKSNLIFIHKISNHMKTKYDLKRLWLTRGVFALLFTMLLLFSGLVSAQTISLTVYGPGNVTVSAQAPSAATFNGNPSVIVTAGTTVITVAGAAALDQINVTALGAPFYQWMNTSANVTLASLPNVSPNSFLWDGVADQKDLEASFYENLTVNIAGTGGIVNVAVGSVVPAIDVNVSAPAGVVSIPAHVTSVALQATAGAGWGFYEWSAGVVPTNNANAIFDFEGGDFGTPKAIQADTRKFVDFTFVLASRLYDGTADVYVAYLTETSTPAITSGVDYTAIIDADFTYADKNVGVGKAVSGDITLTDVVGGYMFTTTVPGSSPISKNFATTGTIITFDLTVSGAVADDKTYDATVDATVDFTGATLNSFGLDDVGIDESGYAATFADKNVAAGIAVTVTGVALTGTDALNYTVSQPAGLTAEIIAFDVAITADDQTKTYGDVINPVTIAGDFTILPALLPNGEIIVDVTMTSLGFVGTAAVSGSPYDIVITPLAGVNYTGAGGFDHNNYNFTAYNDGALTVDPFEVEIIADDITKTYGDVINPATIAGDFTLDPIAALLPNGETILTVTMTSATGFVCNAPVVDVLHTVVPGAPLLTGTANLDNYDVTWTAGNITVDPKALTVTANDRDKVYGVEVVPAGTEFTSSGLACTDVINSVTLTSDGFPVEATFVAPGPTYAIEPSAAVGAPFAASNYTITYTDGTLTVTQRPLTVVNAVAQNKVYDGNIVAVVTGAEPAPFVLSPPSGMMAGDDIFLNNHISGAFQPDATVANGKPVTTAITLGGTDAANYSFNPATSLTANITARPIVITVTPGQSKVYGAADPVYAYTYATGPNVGLAPGQSFDGLLDRAAGETVGSYAIDQGTLTIVNPPFGGSIANYNVTFNADNFTITKKQLTITGAVAQNRVYNADVDATVTGATLTGAEFSDVLTLVDGTVGTFDTKDVGTGKVVTTNMTVTGAAIDNYTPPVTPVLSANITAAGLTATSVAENKEYDGTNTAVLNSALVGLLGTPLDDVTLTNGSVGTFASANVGTWAVSNTIGITGADAGNYTFTTPTVADATISQRPLTVFVPAQSKLYGQPDPSFNYTVTGTLVAGHTWTGALSRQPGEDVGTYAFITNPLTITDAGSNNVTANYNITYTSPAAAGFFTISPTATPVVITADDYTKFRCAADPAVFTVTTTGLYFGDYVTATLARTPAGNDPGTYDIGIVTYTLHTGNPANYSNVSTVTGTLTIIDGPADLVVDIVGYGSVIVRKEDNSVAANIVGPIVGSTVTGFSTNELITLQAVPNAGYVFTGWTQAYTGMVNPVSLTMDCGKFMTATFKKEVSLADITVFAPDKTYDGNTSVPGYTVTYTGPLYPGQLAPTVGVATVTFDNANAGVDKTVSFVHFTLTSLTDFYQLAPGVATSTKTDLANINRRSLPVAGATVPPRVYDGTAIAYIVGAVLDTPGNLITGDVVTLTNHLTGTFTGTTAPNGGANIGTAKTVTHTMTLIGTPAPNYVLVVPALTGDVTPRSLVFTAVTITPKVFDGTTAGKVASVGASSTWQNVISGDAAKLSVGVASAVATFGTPWPGTGKPVTIFSQSPGIVLSASSPTVANTFNPANYYVEYPINTTGTILPPVYAMFTPTYPVVRPVTLPMEGVAIETPLVVEFSANVKDVLGQDLPNSDLGDFFVLEAKGPASGTFTVVPGWSAVRVGNKVTFNIGGNLAWNTEYKIRFQEIYESGTTPGTVPVIWTLDGATRDNTISGALVESKEIHFRTLTYDEWVKPVVTPYGSETALCNQTIKLTFKNPVKYRNTNEITDNPKHKFSLQYYNTTTSAWTTIDPLLWSVSIDVPGNPKVFTFTYTQPFAYNTMYRIKNNIGVDNNYGFIDKVTGGFWLNGEVSYVHSQGNDGWHWESTPMYPLTLSVEPLAAFGATPYNSITLINAPVGVVSTTATISVGVASPTSIVLTAVEGEGYRFVNWSKTTNGGSIWTQLGTASFPATFTLNHAANAPTCTQTVGYRANFVLENYKVSRLAVGNGTVGVTGQTGTTSANTTNHNHYTNAVWTATPTPGNQHTGWTFSSNFPTVGTYSRVVTYGNIAGATPTVGTVSIIFNGANWVDAGSYTLTATFDEWKPLLKASAGFEGTGSQPEYPMIGLIQFTTNFVSSLSNPGVETPDFQGLQYQQVNVKYDTVVSLLAHGAACEYQFVKWQYYNLATSTWMDYVTTENPLGQNPITFKMNQNIRFKAVYKDRDNVVVSATAMNPDLGSVAVYNNPLRREGDLIQFNGAPVGGALQTFVPGTTLYITVFPEPDYQSFRWELAGTNTTTNTVTWTGDFEDRTYYEYVVGCENAMLKAIIGLKEYDVTVTSLNKNEGTINASTPVYGAFVAAESKTVTGFEFTTAANPGTLNMGSGTFQRFQSVTFAATATGTFEFDYWVDVTTSQIVSDQNPYTETVLGERHLRAVFHNTYQAPTYDLAVMANPAQGAVAQVIGSTDVVVTDPVTGVYTTVATQSSTMTFKALPKAGYSFTNWTIMGASVVTTTATTTLTMPAGTVTLTANFVPTQYLVNVNVRTYLRADPMTNFTVVNYGGTVTPVSGTYTAGSTINLVATPASGFRFVNWMVGAVIPNGSDLRTLRGTHLSDQTSYTYTVPAVAGNAPMNVYAIFVEIADFPYPILDLYTEAVSAGTGVQTGAAKYAYGVQALVTAQVTTPGWQFSHWSSNVIAPDDYVNMIGHATATATYTRIPYMLYVLETTALGTVSGTTSFFYNDLPKPVAAAPKVSTNPLYTNVFQGWFTDYERTIPLKDAGGNVVTDPEFNFIPYVLPVPQTSVSIYAKFGQVTNTFSVTAQTALDTPANLDPTVGTATVTPAGGTYNYGQALVVSTTPNPNNGYAFQYWTDPTGLLYIEQQSFNHVVVGDMQFIAVYEAIPYTVTASAQMGGTVTPVTATYTIGQTATVVAAANMGYQFDGWEVVSGTVTFTATSLTATFAMPGENVVLLAKFSKIPYTVTATAETGGTATPATQIKNYGDAVTVTANALPGYTFNGWVDVVGATVTNTMNPLSFTMPNNNVSLKASFVANPYTVSVIAVPANGGTFSAVNPTYTVGQAVSVTATPAAGFEFTGWSAVGVDPVNLASPTVSFTMPAGNVTLTATFAPLGNTLTGNVRYFNQFESMMPVKPGFTVGLYNGASLVGTSTLTASGKYSFTGIAPGTNYTVKVMESGINTPLGGVSAADALIANYMVIHSPVLSSFPWIDPTGAATATYTPFSIEVGDVNNASGVTALDALTILYRTVGNITSYPNNVDFQVAGAEVASLTAKTYPQAPDYIFSYAAGEYSGSWTGKAGLTVFNIYFIASGDLNATYVPQGGSKAKMNLNYNGEITANVGDVITIPVSIDQSAQLGAITLGLSFNNSLLEVTGVEGYDVYRFDNVNGTISIAWMSQNVKNVFANENIVEITAKVLAPIELTDRFFELETMTEFVDGTATPVEVTLTTKSISGNPTSLVENTELISSAYPNPFKDEATISFTLPEAGKVTIVVYNQFGQEVKTLVNESRDANVLNTVQLSRTELDGSGTYFYRIIVEGTAKTYTANGTLILVK